MPLLDLLQHWKSDPATSPNISTWRVQPGHPASRVDSPADLPGEIVAALRKGGIHSLYSHQAAAWVHARQGEHVVLATGTASGKTLAYNLPVMAALLRDPQARAMYLFPTKALAQ